MDRKPRGTGATILQLFAITIKQNINISPVCLPQVELTKRLLELKLFIPTLNGVFAQSAIESKHRSLKRVLGAGLNITGSLEHTEPGLSLRPCFPQVFLQAELSRATCSAETNPVFETIKFALRTFKRHISTACVGRRRD